MYYAGDQGSIAIRRCHICTNALISKSCICQLGFDCDQAVCDQYCPVSQEAFLQRIDRLLKAGNSPRMPGKEGEA